MILRSETAIQALVFLLVGTSFTVFYITQPVLPILEQEFAINPRTASLSISMVVFGIALANLPFGMLADRYPIKPIVLVGGSVITVASLVCAMAEDFFLLIVARFVQGLFIPSLTTCIAAYLSKSLPAARLNVVMGSYVAATVAGGLGGRLLGGWIHPPLHWRYAFVSAAALVATATLAALVWLPNEKTQAANETQSAGFIELLAQPALLRMLAVAFGAFWVFSSTFNFLPFYLAKAPFSASTGVITLMYLPYLIGIVIGPISGKVSNHLGSGVTMVIAAVIAFAAVISTLTRSLPVIAVCLIVFCAGFFSLHSAAVGLLNRRLISSRGRANSLYVRCYYLGGGAGITACGYAYALYGWTGVVGLNACILLLPLAIGLREIVIASNSAS
jgi:MFS transporter, YNFM family, putative membrane transport protein